MLYDAQGRELPETLTGTPGGGGKRVSDGFTNSACTVIVIVLGGVAVAAVRLRRLRRQGRAAQEVAEL